MIYIFDELDKLRADFPDKFKELLSNERYSKYHRLHSSLCKKASAAVYLLLRIALNEVYGINEVVEFDYNEKGKPSLVKYPNIHFSLSHSHNIAACVVSDNPIGLDAQKICPVSDKVAKRVLTKDEYSTYINSREPNDYFCKIWAIKESYIKKMGDGITFVFDDISAEEIIDKNVFKEKDYYCCVCGSATNEMRINHIGGKHFEQLCNGL